MSARRGPSALLGAYLTLLSATVAHGAAVTSVFGGRVPCVPQAGVQFCAGSVATRVATWDGVPLDVNVTVPPASLDGPFPLIVDLHGWSLGKTEAPYVERALQGYVVLSYSARGFHGSCGSPASRAPDPSLANPNVCAERGWVHIADARYEARDTQHLAGLLVDEGLVIPDRIGATGASYGGIQSLILAALRDRVMLPDGTFAAWTSPGGIPMRLAAAAPLIPASDLAYSLVPNGRTLDYLSDNPYGDRGGVQKKSWNDLLYGAGLGTGYYAPPGVDPSADLQSWNVRVAAGEPYDSDPTLRAILTEMTSHHSAYYLDDSVEPAPLLIYNAWTDDLFPVDEALRFWRKTRRRHPTAEIALLFADAFGHPRASLVGDTTRIDARVRTFFARHLQGSGDAALAPFETWTQACGGSAVAGPFTAPDWDALHPGEVRHVDRRTRRFDSTGGDAATARALDPVAGGPCRTVPARDDPGAATYQVPAARGAGYTLLGSPTVIAELVVRGTDAQIAPRLWDVAPDGKQTLVAQSLYRPRTDNLGPQVFQLHPNGWHFAAGHVPKLELLGQSAPYGRPSNGSFTVTVRRLELRLPVRESPDGHTVMPPEAPVSPPTEGEPPICPPRPVTGCRTPMVPGASGISITDSRPERSGGLAWVWRKGPATGRSDLGDPLSVTAYTLCMYDGSGRSLTSTAVPAGGRCALQPCWTTTARGFRYRDLHHARTGLTRVILAAGPAGAARIVVAGRSEKLDVPRLPIRSLPLSVQLLNGEGACWGATFSSAQANRQRRFVATSD